MYQQQWETVDEYFEKYNPVTNPEEYTNFGTVFATFQMAGLYLKEGLSPLRCFMMIWVML